MCQCVVHDLVDVFDVGKTNTFESTDPSKWVLVCQRLVPWLHNAGGSGMTGVTRLENLEPMNAAIGRRFTDDSRTVLFCCSRRYLPNLLRRIIQTTDQKRLPQVEIRTQVNIDSTGLTIRINDQT